MKPMSKPVLRHASSSDPPTQKKMAESSHELPLSHQIVIEQPQKKELKPTQPAVESESSSLLDHLKHTLIDPLDAAAEVMGRIVGKEHYHHPSGTKRN